MLKPRSPAKSRRCGPAEEDDGRGTGSIRAEGSIVFNGNFEVDVETQLRQSHLFGPLPPDIQNDTAFMDRIHSYIPGWDAPKIERRLFTDHFGLGVLHRHAIADRRREARARDRPVHRHRRFDRPCGRAGR